MDKEDSIWTLIFALVVFAAIVILLAGPLIYRRGVECGQKIAVAQTTADTLEIFRNNERCAAIMVEGEPR